MSELRIDVADLLSHPGARRPLLLEAVVAGLGTSTARVDDPVRLDLVLERVPDGLVARGTVHAHWHGECGTCLRSVGSDLDVAVGELFEQHPVDGETYPVQGHEIDLEQLVRDAVLLELPLAPSCAAVGRDACVADVGPSAHAGADDGPDTDSDSDPRWAALSQLEL